MNFLSWFGRPRTAPPLEANRAGAADPAAAVARLLDHAVFVAGRGRSGSSLLLRLFDGHPEVFAIPRESRLFTEVAPQLRESGDRQAAEACLISRFADFRAQDRQMAAADRIRLGMATVDPGSADLPRELFRISLEALAAAQDPGGAKCFLEKTPKNEEHLDEIFALFPRARVIQLVRDPRAVYLSNKRSDAFRMTPEFAAQQWVKSIRRILRHVVKFGVRDQIMVVRYEDLVASPQPTLQAVCDFIGVGFDAALTRPTVYGHPWQGNSYGAQAPATYEIDPAKADSWRKEITPEENAAILGAARFEMSLLGYPAA